MKKQYEKNFAINIFLIIFILLIIFFIYMIFNLKIIIYKKYPGIVMEQNNIVLYIPKNEIKRFYKINCFYINNKKIKFTLKEISKIQKNEGDKNYVYTCFNIDSPTNYDIGETVYVSIQCGKKKAYEIFKIIWEGDSYKNN